VPLETRRRARVLHTDSVLVEFIADLFPKAGIFPSDPVQRAQTRFFVDQATVKYVDKYVSHLYKGTPTSEILAGVDTLQALLPADKKFAFGDELTAADIALAPFLIRSEIVFTHIRGDSDGFWKTLQTDKYARFWKYFQDLKAHPVIAGTYDEVRSSSLYSPVKLI
jgi:glutathione S-transferase